MEKAKTTSIEVPDYFIVKMNDNEQYLSSPLRQASNIFHGLSKACVAALRRGINKEDGNRYHLSNSEFDYKTEKVIEKNPRLINDSAIDGFFVGGLAGIAGLILLGTAISVAATIPVAATGPLILTAGVIGAIVGGKYGQQKERHEYEILADRYLTKPEHQQQQQLAMQQSHDVPQPSKSFVKALEAERARAQQQQLSITWLLLTMSQTPDNNQIQKDLQSINNMDIDNMDLNNASIGAYLHDEKSANKSAHHQTN